MAPHKEADCIDCRINRRIRDVAREMCGCGERGCEQEREWRKFGRAVARAVKKELEAERE